MFINIFLASSAMKQSITICMIGMVLFAVSLLLTGIWNNYFVESHGVKIVGFMTNSPAQKAGLVDNDMIISIDGKQIITSKDFVQVLKTKKPNDLIILQTLRGITPVVLGREQVFGTGRLGVFVEPVKSYLFAPQYFEFTVEQIISVIYWLGIIHLIVGFALVFGKTAPLTEFFALNALNVLDLASTHYFLQLGRVEGNPFGVFLLENLGFTGTAILKIIIVLIGSAIFVWLSHPARWHKKSLAKTLIHTHRVHLRGTILLYLLAVLVNIGVIV